MLTSFIRSLRVVPLVAAFVLGTAVHADEAEIRRNLTALLGDGQKIDEVRKTPMPGLYEVRVGTELLYSDEQGNYVIQGQLVDARSGENLTEARVRKITAIDFASLPLKDAIVFKQGTGARKLVVFADPNCGYCKRFERDLNKVKDVTVYTFLYPILGEDSSEKSRDIWCAKDSTRAWRDWMVDGKAPVRTMGQCDTSALERNTAMGRKYKVNGTPALVFEDGTRIPGALPADQVEKQLVAARAK
jgi:thiol:disulfide interchange protein DsbC